MALFLPKCFYIKDLIHINGEDSIVYFIELYIAIVTAIYNGKQVYYNNTSKEIMNIDINVYNWKKNFHLSFYDFIDNINYFFRYKGFLPFYCKKNREDMIEYGLEINYRYYQMLDRLFHFPNPNEIITKLIDRFCKIKPSITTPKCLKLCKFVYPIQNRYISWKKKVSTSVSSEQTVSTTISSGPSLIDKFEQVEQQKDMYSSMIDYIHHVSQRVSPDELIKQISEVHSIKVARHCLEENPCKKPRIDTPDYD